jgi:hypothetical protein
MRSCIRINSQMLTLETLIAANVNVVNFGLGNYFTPYGWHRRLASAPSGVSPRKLKAALVRAAIDLIEERREAFSRFASWPSVWGESRGSLPHFRSKRELLAQIAEEGFRGLQLFV